jgi:hypothetical protein
MRKHYEERRPSERSNISIGTPRNLLKLFDNVPTRHRREVLALLSLQKPSLPSQEVGRERDPYIRQASQPGRDDHRSVSREL